MYPSTKFEIVDQSYINALNIVDEDSVDRPYMMQVFAAPKGPEEWQNGIMSKKFYNYYGDVPLFNKYGQPLLQATMLASEGARMVTKRVVSDTAMLANILVYAEVNRHTEQELDEDGNPVYYDVSGNKTTDVTQANTSALSPSPYGTFDVTGVDCATVDKCQVVFHADTYNFGYCDATREGLKKWKAAILTDPNYNHSAPIGTVGVVNDLDPMMNVDANTVGAVYPLFFISDNGRGVSNKSVKIYTDETARRPVAYSRYIIECYEGSKRLEQLAFTLNPDQTENGINVSVENSIKLNSDQLRAIVFYNETIDFAQQVADISGLDYDTVMKDDLLYNADVYGRAITDSTGKAVYESVWASGVDFSTGTGVMLDGGDNGLFENTPLNSVEYEDKLNEAFYNYSDEIYDLDNFPVYMIADANYPDSTKRTIEKYVHFRDDVYYMRDMGTEGLTTLASIEDKDKLNSEDRAIGTYHMYYDIIDPVSKKQITVTSTYLNGLRFVDHYLNGASRPFCGIRYGVVFPEVIDGTVNFCPKITPTTLSGDQKQVIDDLRINYGGYYSGQLVLETNYTSQRKNTELDFMCNVLAIQNLIRQIRKQCPKIRYAFFTDNTGNSSNSFSKYIEDVQAVIDKCAPDFASISLTYEQNNVYENNKIFYAAIEVSNPDWIQAERFKITVVQNV